MTWKTNHVFCNKRGYDWVAVIDIDGPIVSLECPECKVVQPVTKINRSVK